MAKNIKGEKGRGGELNSLDRSAELINSGGAKGKAPKMVPQPRDEESGELAMRGMSSEDGAKHWKKTGLKVPKDAGQNHKGK